MITRSAHAVWEGNLKSGKGSLRLESGAFTGAYSFASRFESGRGTNPEELIGAAHAGCFSMALAFGLEQAGYSPQRISTTANVQLDQVAGSFRITSIELETEGEVPGIEEEDFLHQARTAKDNCPVSQALAGTPIRLVAHLVAMAR